MAAVITCDFDDTVILENSTSLLFDAFSPGWRELESDYHAGRLTVEQYNAQAFGRIQAPLDDLLAVIREGAHVRPGFVELCDWANWHGWHVAVVSNGFDICVNTVLDSLGLDRIARHAGRTRYTYQWRVRYDSPRGIEIQDRFKVAYASAYRAAGDFVVYCGDGASDVDAAGMSQAVFARDTLLERLGGQHPRLFAFETFHDVITVLEREGQAWLASFSSTTAAAD